MLSTYFNLNVTYFNLNVTYFNLNVTYFNLHVTYFNLPAKRCSPLHSMGGVPSQTAKPTHITSLLRRPKAQIIIIIIIMPNQ